MENAGIEALIIGVNVLIFVAALSVAIMLMVNVLDMSNTANDIIKSNNKGSLVETKDVEYIKVISGQELLKYHTKNIKDIYVKPLGETRKVLSAYINSIPVGSLYGILTKKYKISMEEILDIDSFVFEETTI